MKARYVKARYDEPDASMIIPVALKLHLKRAYEDIVAGSYPQSFDEVCFHFIDYGASWGLVDDVSHWHLARNDRSPHRATVSVAVEREHRRMDLGLRCLVEAENVARKLGVEWLDGWLWEDNEAALRLDMKFGFTIVGRIEDAWRYPDGKPRTMLLVAKRVER